MTRGVVLFGVNNATIDYVQLAVMAAGFIRKNMPGVPICLITDINSLHYQNGKGRWKVEDFFDMHVLLPENIEQQFENKRTYRDTRYYYVEDTFKNETRSSVYDLSPFDETLLIDVDYLVCNNALNNVWGSEEEVMINNSATNLLHRPLTGQEYRVNPYGIRMYWATVIYFRKGEKSKLLFDLVDHIKENWEFYTMLYELPGRLFRNDYAFSIAIHILNGFTETGGSIALKPKPTHAAGSPDAFADSMNNAFVSPLPVKEIHTALDTDQFYDIASPSQMRFFVNDLTETWKFYMTRLTGINVHCMNKISLLNNMEDIMEVLA